MGELLYENREKVKVIRNFLYGNNLREEEVDKVISEALNHTFLKGLDSGCIVQRNNRKRIEGALLAVQDKKFKEWMSDLEDDIYQKKLDKKKKK